MELYQWLEPIKRTKYYTHFYQQEELEKNKTIAKIDNNIWKNDLEITKLDCILEFEEETANLKRELRMGIGMEGQVNVTNGEKDLDMLAQMCNKIVFFCRFYKRLIHPSNPNFG